MQFARFFSALSSFWALPGGFFCVFLCLGPIYWSSRGLLCSFFASWIRKGTYLCQLAPPDHQLGGKWGHKVDFSPPWGSFFGPLFGIFPYFSEFCDFVKIEILCRRELGFEGPGRSKCHFFLPWNPFQKSVRIWRLITGGGDPPGNLERTRGPTSCGQNAYRDSHRLWPKSTTLCRGLETKLGTVAKEPWSSSKAQNIKEGIT